MTALEHRIINTTVSPLVSGAGFQVGSGFEALGFKEPQFAGLMDPIVMADHYTMTASTFGEHPHAGMSAVTVLFEDSQGAFRNRDSLGNDVDLQAGDLYWLVAGSGAVHDEAPRPGSRAHGLQLFINLPAALKQQAPASLHVRAVDMPELVTEGYRVRVVLGESQQVQGAESPALPATILDGYLNNGAVFSQPLKAGHSAWIYAVSGQLDVYFGGDKVTIPAGQSLSLRQEVSAPELDIQLEGIGDTHMVLISARPIDETFVQRGPFVMSTATELEQVEADFAAGKLGRLA